MCLLWPICECIRSTYGEISITPALRWIVERDNFLSSWSRFASVSVEKLYWDLIGMNSPPTGNNTKLYRNMHSSRDYVNLAKIDNTHDRMGRVPTYPYARTVMLLCGSRYPWYVKVFRSYINVGFKHSSMPCIPASGTESSCSIYKVACRRHVVVNHDVNCTMYKIYTTHGRYMGWLSVFKIWSISTSVFGVVCNARGPFY